MDAARVSKLTHVIAVRIGIGNEVNPVLLDVSLQVLAKHLPVVPTVRPIVNELMSPSYAVADGAYDLVDPHRAAFVMSVECADRPTSNGRGVRADGWRARA